MNKDRAPTIINIDPVLAKLERFDATATALLDARREAFETLEGTLYGSLMSIVEVTMLDIEDQVKLDPYRRAGIHSSLTSAIGLTASTTSSLIQLGEITKIQGPSGLVSEIGTEAVERFSLAQQTIISELWEMVND